MKNQSVLPISEYTSYVGVVQESVAIYGVPEDRLEADSGPKVARDSTLFTSVPGLVQKGTVWGP